MVTLIIFFILLAFDIIDHRYLVSDNFDLYNFYRLKANVMQMLTIWVFTITIRDADVVR